MKTKVVETLMRERERIAGRLNEIDTAIRVVSELTACEEGDRVSEPPRRQKSKPKHESGNKKPSSSHRRWTPEQDELLCQLRPNHTVAEIAGMVGHPVGSTRDRIHHLGLKKRVLPGNHNQAAETESSEGERDETSAVPPEPDQPVEGQKSVRINRRTVVVTKSQDTEQVKAKYLKD